MGKNELDDDVFYSWKYRLIYGIDKKNSDLSYEYIKKYLLIRS